jgi:hypothetical protein
MATKEEVINALKRVPTGNLPEDHHILAEALIYLIKDNEYRFRQR